MKKLSLSVFALCALMSSCKKDDKKDTSTATEATIADKKWKLTAFSYVQDGVTVEAYTKYPNCQTDNFRIFSSDKSLVLDEGETKCNSFDLQTKKVGTWELRYGGKELITSAVDVNGTIIETTMTILESTASTLKVKYRTPYIDEVVENISTYTAM